MTEHDDKTIDNDETDSGADHCMDDEVTGEYDVKGQFQHPSESKPEPPALPSALGNRRRRPIDFPDDELDTGETDASEPQRTVEANFSADPWDAKPEAESSHAVMPVSDGTTPDAPLPAWSEAEQAQDAGLAGDGTDIIETPLAEDIDGVANTQVTPEMEKRPQEFPFLIVTQGEDEGREIDLFADKLSMGRSADNDLVFPDIACSRHHSVLEKQGNEYLVLDLGSGNGTLVNGERVERVVLQNSDEIQIGNTVIQFNQPNRAVVPSAANTMTVTNAQTMAPDDEGGFLRRLLADNAKRKLILFGGGGVAGLLIILTMLKFSVAPVETQDRSLEQIKQQKQLRSQQEFKEYMQKVVELVKEKKWQQAALYVQMALKIRPDDEIALDYLKFIKREKSSERDLQEAFKAFERKEYPQVMVLLRQVDEQSDSFAEATQLKKRTELEIVNALIEEAQGHISQKQYAQAIIKLDELLKADSDNVMANQLKEKALSDQEKDRKRQQEEAARKRRNSRRGKPRPKKKEDPKVAARKKVMEHYKGGELIQAIHLAQSKNLKRYEKTLQKFKTAYENGMALVKNTGQASKAQKFLLAAWKIDKKFSGGKGSYHLELKKKLAKVYFIQGVDAEMGKRLPDAYKNFVSAKKFGDKNAQKRLENLEKTAKKYFNEAYIIKGNDPDLAVKRLDTVLRIVPASHTVYKKSKRLKASILGPSDYETEEDSGF